MVIGINEKKLKYFCRGYSKINSVSLLVKIIFSFGTYIISWIYFQNKEFEKIDDNAPNSLRGSIILFFLPLGFLSITIPLKLLIFKDSKALWGIEITVWSLLIFLSLKYIFDFCESFGRITNSNKLLWYLLFYSGYFGVVLAIFDFNKLWFLAFIPPFTIFFMQAYLNKIVSDYNFRRERDLFNSKSPEEY